MSWPWYMLFFLFFFIAFFYKSLTSSMLQHCSKVFNQKSHQSLKERKTQGLSRQDTWLLVEKTWSWDKEEKVLKVFSIFEAFWLVDLRRVLFPSFSFIFFIFPPPPPPPPPSTSSSSPFFVEYHPRKISHGKRFWEGTEESPGQEWSWP